MTHEERLIKIYQEAQQHLINLIAYKQARGSVTYYQETLLRQINMLLAELNFSANSIIKVMIEEAYYQGAQEAVTGLEGMGLSVSPPSAFATLHAASVEVLAANASGMLSNGVSFVGRQTQDIVRQAGIDAIAQKQATGSTVKEASRMVKERMLANGVKAVRTRDGKMISLDAYSKLVARTTTREATNQGLKNQLSNLGYDLVKMSEHLTTCGLCAALQGRVYSISGTSPDYPPLSMAHRNGFANVHPNCRHVLMPYVPALADDVEGDKAFSNRPFDIDPRSKAAIARYDKDQAEKRRLRMDRLQWERYKLALGEDAPKTLSGFRRMKEAKSQRWQELQSDYREFTRS